MATWYLDFSGGSDAADGTSFANRRKTLGTFTAGELAPGDTIRIMKSADATSLGQSASWTNLSPTVTLTSAVTANISLCNAAWTASANVTTTTSTTRKEGANSTQIAPGAAFTTGLAAYEALGASTDFSGYQQVSFWIRQSSGTLGAASSCSIKLCSDTVGATPVDTINIPAIPALNQWFCVTVDTGGALGAAIQSVAFYVNTDNGAQTFLIDNILACKASSSADSLTLNSLIGKNADDGLWWPIRSINGTTVTIDTNFNSDAATTSRGYVGTTESVTTYKREPIIPVATNGNFATLNDSGSSGSVITISGGWNTTDMTTQTGETWVSNQGGASNSVGLNLSTMSFVTCEKLSWVRYTTGISITTGVNNTFGSTCHVLGSGTGLSQGSSPSGEQTTAMDFGYSYCNASGIVTGGAPGFLLGTIQGVLSNTTVGISFNSTGSSRSAYVLSAKNNGGSALQFGTSGAVGASIRLGTVSGNAASGLSLIGTGNRVFVYDGTFSGNTTSSVALSAGALADLQNCTLSDATEFSGATAGQGARARSQKHDGTADNHYIWDHLGVIQSESSVRHTASGIAWKMSPTTSTAVSNAPLALAIARVACAASALVTVKAWMRRTNTGLTMKLVCKGGQIGGVSSDVTASMTASADTWEELTITFTPNEAGVVEIEAHAYGGTTYSGYVDDLTISQA